MSECLSLLTIKGLPRADLFYAVNKGVLMNVDCPYCQASSVCESTNNAAEQAVDQLSNLAALDRTVSELCQSLGLHPLIKLVLSMTLVIAIEHVTSNRGELPVAQKPYRCEGCNKVFTVFYPFV